MKRSLALLLVLTGCVGGWNPFDPEPREMCITTVWTTLVEDGPGMLLRTDSITYTGDPPCIEVTEMVS